METLYYHEGYVRALMDLAGFVNRAAAPLNKRLCTAKNLQAVINYIIENVDEFAVCPHLFEFEFEIDKKKLTFIRGKI